LSPQSVLIGDDGRVMLADMGLIPALRPPSSPPGRPWGRFPYLSPEQAAGDEIHPSSDVYVIGVLLYEMLAGRPPFDSADESTLALQHLRQTPTPLLALAPRVPQSLAQIVHKSLAKEPSARYRNAGQVATILRSQIPRTVAENQQDGAGVMEPAVLHPIPAMEHLVIPPPQSGPAVQSSYHHGQTGIWVDEPGGMDWLMIALIIVALISVLGLIPLWRSVYRRYTAPPPGSPAFSYFLPGNSPAHSQPFIGLREGHAGRPCRQDKCDVGFRLLRDGPEVSRQRPGRTRPRSHAVWSGRGATVEEAGRAPRTRFSVWESRLRL
jgi:serine/threonine protein kinase